MDCAKKSLVLVSLARKLVKHMGLYISFHLITNTCNKKASSQLCNISWTTSSFI